MLINQNRTSFFVTNKTNSLDKMIKPHKDLRFTNN